MKPGRELDALVAEKVFGITALDRQTREEKPITATQVIMDFQNQLDRIPRFSTDIAAAWLVVKKLEAFFELERMPWQDDQWTAKFRSDGYDGEAIGETAPHAICLAALKAVGHEL